VRTSAPRLERWLRPLASTPFLAAVIALITWPHLDVYPSFGLDPSWETGLNLAAERGLDFGSGIVFTYGPLGFLEAPSVISGHLAVLAALYTVAVRIGLAATLLWAARRSFHPVVAFLVAAVAAALIQDDEVVAIAFVLALAGLGKTPPERLRPLVALAVGAASALALLGKLSPGLIVLALAVVALVGMENRRARDFALFAGGFVVALLAAWLVTGQPLGDLLDYGRHSVEILSGYSSAMALEQAPTEWDRWVAVAGGIAAVAATFYATSGWPLARRLAAFAVLAIVAFTGYKQGFVRHDQVHIQVFVPLLILPWLAFEWAGRSRFVALGAIAVFGALYFPVTDHGPGEVIEPLDRAEAAVDDLSTLLVPSERADTRSFAHESLRKFYDLDDGALEAIGDEPVHIYPWETSTVWAYGFEWKPLPVFQSYSAYTPELDELNAAELESETGVSRVLRHVQSDNFSIDNRFAPWEAPETMLAMLCNFEAAYTDDEHQVLERVPNRCGEPVPISSQQAVYGQEIEIPEPASRGDVVIARVSGIAPGARERLRAFLYKGLARTVAFDAVRGYRVLPETADGAPLLAAIPPEVDFPRPFGLDPGAETMVLGIEPGFGDAGTLDVEFLSLPVRPRSG
jgi:hypothetical protein